MCRYLVFRMGWMYRKKEGSDFLTSNFNIYSLPRWFSFEQRSFHSHLMITVIQITICHAMSSSLLPLRPVLRLPSGVSCKGTCVEFMMCPTAWIVGCVGSPTLWSIYWLWFHSPGKEWGGGFRGKHKPLPHVALTALPVDPLLAGVSYTELCRGHHGSLA